MPQMTYGAGPGGYTATTPGMGGGGGSSLPAVAPSAGMDPRMTSWMRQAMEHKMREKARAQKRREYMEDMALQQSMQPDPLDKLRAEQMGIQNRAARQDLREQKYRFGELRKPLQMKRMGGYLTGMLIQDPEAMKRRAEILGTSMSGSVQGYGGGQDSKAMTGAGEDLAAFTGMDALTQENMLRADKARGQRQYFGGTQAGEGQEDAGQPTRYGTGPSVRLTPEQQRRQSATNRYYGR